MTAISGGAEDLNLPDAVRISSYAVTGRYPFCSRQKECRLLSENNFKFIYNKKKLQLIGFIGKISPVQSLPYF
jgi:hypothetical protein